jgi:hypothetical protein
MYVFVQQQQAVWKTKGDKGLRQESGDQLMQGKKSFI